MLGTGNAAVTECYNTCFVIDNGGRKLLVDAGGGNGILTQLKRAGINLSDVRDIIVTHKHIDHILGVVWLVRMICQNMNKGKFDGTVNICGHDEVVRILSDLCVGLLQESQSKLIGERVFFLEVKDGETHSIIGKDVTFFDIRSTKAKQFGFTMSLGENKKLTCCGDEPYVESEYPYAVNSDFLMHEAFCLYSQAHIFDPYAKHHSTVKDACSVAEKLGVKNLILYHTEDKNLKNRKALYEEEGKKYFSGNLFVPDDLEKIELQ